MKVISAARPPTLAKRIHIWLDGLRYRPALWLAPAIVLGCVFGAHLAGWLALATPNPSRESLFLLYPLPFSALLFALWFRWRKRDGFLSRLAFFVAVVLTLSTLSARRVLPPPHDVSKLANAATARPNQRVPVVLQGWVAAIPRRGDFGVEFPLECARAALSEYSQSPLPARNGRVWIRAPLDVAVAVGDAVTVKAELAELPAAGNRGERSRRTRYLLENCWSIGTVRNKDNIKLARSADRYAHAQMIAATRLYLLENYERNFTKSGRIYPAMTAQLLTAMVFGEGGLREPLPRQIRDDFRAAGLSHILVASGAQVALFAAIMLGGAHLLGLRRWWLAGLILPVLVFYALVAGGEASIWRATIAGLLLTAAIILGHETDGLTLWSIALGVLLLINPAGIFDLSLQLSFAATWGLLALAPLFRRVLGIRFGFNSLTDLAALTLGAQLAVMPIIMFHFGRLSVASGIVNLLGVPLAGILVTTGVIGVVLPVINPLNYALTQALADLSAFAARLPGANIETPFLQARWWQRKREAASQRGDWIWRPQSWVLLALFCLDVWIAWQIFSTTRSQLLIAALDVGQGEALVVRSPSGRTVLIDGGTVAAPDRGDVGRGIIVPYLNSLGVKKIDALVITHADADHVNGLPFVLREIPVGLVIDGAAQTGTQSTQMASTEADEADYLSVRASLETRNIPIYPAAAGQKLNLGDDITIQVLAPIEPLLEGANNNAAVVRVEYGGVSALLTGDIEREAEERLVRRGLIQKSTILKVAHHGSQTSTSPLLLQATQPRAAVISCGRYNTFGHPSPQTLQRLMQAKIPTFRTDRQGAIEFWCERDECRVQTYK